MLPIRRRLYQSLAGFTPRQLFAALQGAWLEPVVGNIWQETTGVTPTTTGGQTIGRIADLSGYGNVATQATAANRPTYQLDSNGLPLARHDATDSLSVSLPAINVRRNLLTWSERFSQSPWTDFNSGNTITDNAAVSPYGAAAKIIPKATNAQHFVYAGATGLTAGARYTYSVVVKTIGGYRLSIAEGNNVTGGVQANLSAGTITVITGTGNWTGSIADLGNGWYRVSGSCTLIGTIHNCRTEIYNASGQATYTGDGTSGIYVSSAQLELGSVATDYQKITDWTSEAYSSNGSVYFATPVGMSALHNQSMGTTYQLPALSTDIYSWIVVPQRLNTAQENRLERYMLRKANLTEPDYLLDDDGNQLMSDDYELLLRQ